MTDPNQSLPRAKIILLKRPAKRERAKVVTGSVAIVSGPHAGKTMTFSNHNMYIFGHHMNKADLLYHVKAGDEYIVEIKDNANTPVVVRLFLGNRDDKPLDPSKCKDFAKWLASKSLDLASFRRWQNDSLELKPFFPLVGETFAATLQRLYWDSMNLIAVGLLKITSEKYRDQFVVFNSPDLYMYGVNVGDADIRQFLRKGDVFTCQLQPLTSAEKKRIRKIVGNEVGEINYVADLVYNGDQRPRCATINTIESPELQELLSSLGRTVEEFDAMRLGSVEVNSQANQSFVEATPQSSINHFYPSYVVPQNFNPSVSQAVLASALTAKAMTVASTDDPRISEIITSQDELNVTAHLSKVFTLALLSKIGSMGPGASDQSELSHFQSSTASQMMQLQAADDQLHRLQQPPADHNPIMNAIQASAERKMRQQEREVAQQISQFNQLNAAKAKALEMTKRFEELEAAQRGDSQERQTSQEPTNPKSNPNMTKKFRTMLKSFKAAKKVENGDQSDNRSKGSEERSLSSSDTDESRLDPLELLRRYKSEGKQVTISKSSIHFDKVTHSKDTLTRLKATSAEPEYYTLFSVYFFLENVAVDYNEYLKRAYLNEASPIRRSDRESVISYMCGVTDDIPILQSKEALSAFISGPSRSESRGEYGATASTDRLKPGLPQPIPSKRRSRWASGDQIPEQPTAEEDSEYGGPMASSGKPELPKPIPSKRKSRWELREEKEESSSRREHSSPYHSQDDQAYDPFNPTDSSPPRSSKRNKWDDSYEDQRSSQRGQDHHSGSSSAYGHHSPQRRGSEYSRTHGFASSSYSSTEARSRYEESRGRHGNGSSSHYRKYDDRDHHYKH